MRTSARFSTPESGDEPTDGRGIRPSSDRLSLSGRAGRGMVAYRSDSLHLWVVGSNLDSDEVQFAVRDLEHSAWSLSRGAMAPPGLGLPLDVHHLGSGLQFLRETLWASAEGAPCTLWGIVARAGRIWAVRAGVEAAIEQLTGAPLRPRWHPHGGEPAFEWCELGAGEVWRVTAHAAGGEAHAHYRPALAALPPDPALVWENAESALAQSQAPAPRPETSRRQRRRERRALGHVHTSASPEHAAEPAPPAELPFLEPKWARAIGAAGAPASAPARARSAAIPRLAPKARPWQPGRAWPSRRALALTGAAAGLLALASLLVFARRPLSAFVAGSFEAEFVTVPAGARISVDGVPRAERTPAVLALEPGEHRVELRYGEFAQAAFTIDGERDARVRRDVAWLGSLGVASADTTVRLAVSLDGRPWGKTPLWRDELPVGRHRLSFEAPGVRAWEEEALVRAGQSTRVSAQPSHLPPFGLVTASAERVSTDGVEDVEGAAVYVDAERAGDAPLDLKLPPGPHSVRIVSGGTAGPVHLIEVQAGGRYFASTQFGRPPEPDVRFDPPARLSLAAPPRLSVRLVSDLPLPVRQIWAGVQSGTGPFTRCVAALTKVEDRMQGTLVFPTQGLAPGARVSYYVVVQTREGEEYASEVRRITVTP